MMQVMSNLLVSLCVSLPVQVINLSLFHSSAYLLILHIPGKRKTVHIQYYTFFPLGSIHERLRVWKYISILSFSMLTLTEIRFSAIIVYLPVFLYFVHNTD